MPNPPLPPPSPVEGIKARSRYLRGTFVESLADPATGALRPDDAQLSKFHGFYQQDDRDERAARQRQKLEPLYAFMLRICVPGGVLTPAQWLALDDLAERYGDGGLRITTRQAVQLHGVIKRDLRPTIAAIHQAMLSTLAACGDVNRNVMGTPLADSPRLTATLERVVRELSVALAPRTRAYHELWLDGEKVAAEAPPSDEEPLYGPTYLPRKFKCAVALPPDNDVDVYTQDLGLVAIADGEELLGFDVLVGGGMGRSHGDDSTYPRLASALGFCPTARVVEVARAVLLAQRDLGNRAERHHARLKYTVDRLGLDAFRREVEARQGFAFAPPRPFVLHSTLDRVGFFERGGQMHLQLYLPCGRVRDTPLRTALRELARVHQGELRLTPNQHLLLTHIAPKTRPALDAIVARYQLLPQRSGLRLSSLACVALPTCGQAMAEAERYLPDLLSRLEGKLAELGLADEPIVLRMTGCPNGCARPYAAEIGLVGRAPGLYELYLGGSRRGDRLARRVAHNLDEAAIVAQLGALFARWRQERRPDEALGDFCVRQGLVPGEEPSAS
jgi:sulfite reductase (NADPH) hemoprotein beta-component